MIAWFVLLASTAHADEQAKELFVEGRTLYNQGRYEQAIEAWREAYALDPRPVLMFNLSNAYERSGQFEEALQSLETYRPAAKPEEVDALESRIRTLRERVEQAQEKEREAEAERLAAEKALEEERRRAEELAAQQAKKPPVVPIVVTAAGVGLLGFGAIEGLSALGARRELNDPNTCTDTGICKEGAEELFARQRRSALLADVGLLSGAAVTGLGVYLFTRGGKADDLQVVPAVSFGQTSTVGVTGAF